MEDDKKLRRQVEKLVREHPNLVAEVLLTDNYWLKELEVMHRYSRIGDDNDSTIAVSFSQDGDGWIDVISKNDPEDPGTTRFRTGLGGGSSHATRNALLLLAVAIKLDNEHHPQEYRHLDLGI